MASRNLLSEAFGVFNQVHQSKQKPKNAIAAGNGAERSPEKRVDRVLKSLKLTSEVASKSGRSLEKKLETAVSPGDVCEMVREPPSCNDDKSEKRRKALDAILLRDLAALGM